MRHLILSLALILSPLARAADPAPAIRVGALAFGTLNWELAIIGARGLDASNGIRIEKTELAGPDAGRIGLRGNSLDVIVSDWIWVAQQRGQAQDLVFAPYSTSHGALMTAGASGLQGLGDLKGKRLGVAGGGIDKNWLLLKALAARTLQLDLESSATITFAAPPLLEQQLRQGQLDAVLTYWNYAARLEATGFRRLLDGRDITRRLGIDTEVPALGYVFHEGWARANPAAARGFLRATAEARRLICESDPDWREVIPLTQETVPAVQESLRRHYCQGRVTAFGDAERKAAAEIYRILGASADTGAPAPLPAGVFWADPG